MNREIKFRVWDKKNNRFCSINIDDYTIKFQGDIWLISGNSLDKDCFPFAVINGERFIMQQFTGLKDKNGREIYEGDIIHYVFRNTSERGEFEDYTDDVKFEVKFYDGKFGGWQYQDYCGYWKLKYPINVNCDNWRVKKFEVVGNIFENPALLNEK